MFDKESKEAGEYGVGRGGDSFRFAEGKNRVRVLAGGTPIAQHWINGKPTVCYGQAKGCPHHGANAPKDKNGAEAKPRVQNAFYILDKSKANPEIQLAYFPYTVFKAIKAFSEEEDYAFEELPMTYDIGVTYDPDQPPGDMYKVIAGRIVAPVDQVVLDELAKKVPIEDVVRSQKDKAAGITPNHTTDKEEDEPDESLPGF